ncbi:hypothetical protein NPIL_6281 [Nephila pilipes]|uniref:Uncharacterized protein n=1 Tax=Nephila pilipes TaxID=299642 RepID=A0A8X6QLK0_NEPPI|nr:hypothetical protein NPIL_6281 [Nephila pilipes]
MNRKRDTGLFQNQKKSLRDEHLRPKVNLLHYWSGEQKDTFSYSMKNTCQEFTSPAIWDKEGTLFFHSKPKSSLNVKARSTLSFGMSETKGKGVEFDYFIYVCTRS